MRAAAASSNTLPSFVTPCLIGRLSDGAPRTDNVKCLGQDLSQDLEIGCPRLEILKLFRVQLPNFQGKL